MRQVSSHTLPMGAELTELRWRLYRPGPPPGAVAAYLQALRAVAAPAPSPRRAGHRRKRTRHVLGPLCVVAAFVALVIGLAPAVGSMGRVTPVVPPRVGVARLAVPPVPGRPIGTLFGGKDTAGVFAARGAQAIVSVNCTGDGTLSIRIAAETPVVLACSAGGPALAMLSSTGDIGRFTLSVTRDGPVRWSLAAGALARPRTEQQD